MKFLIFWGVSTAICFLILFIFAKALENKIKREFEPVELPKLILAEKVTNYLPYLIPFVNILLTLMLLFMQELALEKVVEKFGLVRKEDK